LLNAHFDLRNFRAFDGTLEAFEAFAETEEANRYENFRTHISIYINTARINGHLMKGTFATGVKLVPEMEEKLSEYSLYVDQHRILVFNYKFASLYFGNRQYDKAIDYLQQIINGPVDLRIDLQSYARLMHLMCHYELGNYEILDSLVKAVHRFMLRMKNLTLVEEVMFRFLKKNYQSPQQIKEALKEFLDQIKDLEKNRFETRAFAYLDIISWVESKVYNKSMSEVLHEKYMKSRRK
jgi:hemerythrin superfamily protein